MDFVHVTAGADDDGRRLDKIVRRYLGEASLSELYGAIRKDLVKADGKKGKPETRVRAGTDIAIARFLVEKNNPQITQMTQMAGDASPMDMDRQAEPLRNDLILFRNEDVLVLHKPYDLSVQKARRGDVSLADMVAADYAARKEKHASLSFRPGPLHRLDRKTTGIIVFSQSLRGAHWFSHALQTHAVRKTYLALLQGNLESPATWEDFIAEERKITTDYTNGTDYRNGKTKNLCKSVGQRPLSVDNNKKRVTSPPAFFHTVALAEDGKYAHTTASPLAYGSYHGSPVTLARVEIGTGRKHQIRAQAAAHGFPLLGDTAYGGRAIRAEQDFFLHAWRLQFGENPLGLPAVIMADISTKFEKMLSNCLIKFEARL